MERVMDLVTVGAAADVEAAARLIAEDEREWLAVRGRVVCWLAVRMQMAAGLSQYAAERLFDGHPTYDARSAGTEPGARVIWSRLAHSDHSTKMSKVKKVIQTVRRRPPTLKGAAGAKRGLMAAVRCLKTQNRFMLWPQLGRMGGFRW